MWRSSELSGKERVRSSRVSEKSKRRARENLVTTCTRRASRCCRRVRRDPTRCGRAWLALERRVVVANCRCVVGAGFGGLKDELQIGIAEAKKVVISDFMKF